ncbi:MAG: AI-2E family transporter [Planctomycetaceae bacterium]
MRQQVSFWFLLATVLGMGTLFFHVLQPFLAPLFLAAVLALLIHPVFEHTERVIGGRHRTAAGLTVFVLLLCLIPLGVALIVIGREIMVVGHQLSQTDIAQHPIVRGVVEFVQGYFPDADWQSLKDSISQGLKSTSRDVFLRTQDFLSDAVAFVVGLAIMGLALYYFLAEGPVMLRKLQRLSPLEDGEEEILFHQFARVCRGVVIGTLLCAVAQATLLGLGLWIAGVDHVWVLTGLTLLFSMIPFLGSASVWGPVTAWLLWQGQIGAALFVGAYGAAVVSTADNLIRAHVLHGAANMHPLLALVSALGGLKLVGLWGVFLGPIVAALFYTLLKVMDDRLESNPDREASEMLKELGTGPAKSSKALTGKSLETSVTQRSDHPVFTK